jgi:tRNA(Ile)-lysidine synthase
MTDSMLAAVQGLSQAPLVMLSGGRDSACLAHLAARAIDGVRALHVDHGLRPDSEADADACRALCAELGVALVVERAPAAPATGNLQAWARDVRLAAAARHAEGAKVALAHTATDQAETVLYRLASSPGRRALLGMRAESERGGCRLVRPLLPFTRADTTRYCEDHGVAFVDDPGNATGAFARGRVRNGLAPALAAVHPDAERNVLRTAAILRDEAEVLDALVAAETGGGAIAVERLRALPPALARLVVQALADAAPGGPVPGAAARTTEIAALGEGALDVGRGVRARVHDGMLAFEPSQGRAARAQAVR